MRPSLLAAAFALAVAGNSTADDTRTFQVSVDGKSAGQYVVKVGEKDGKLEVTGTTRVEVKHRFGRYHYEQDSTEVWKDGKLVSMTTTCNDDGSRHQVSVSTDGKTATITADGRAVRVTGEVVPTSYWKLLPAGNLTLVDSDDGKLIAAKLEKVGEEKVRVGAADLAATKYRLTGRDLDLTLWYDAGGRLVRETFAERGHRTTLELTEPK